MGRRDYPTGEEEDHRWGQVGLASESLLILAWAGQPPVRQGTPGWGHGTSEASPPLCEDFAGWSQE